MNTATIVLKGSLRKVQPPDGRATYTLDGEPLQSVIEAAVEKAAWWDYVPKSGCGIEHLHSGGVVEIVVKASDE